MFNIFTSEYMRRLINSIRISHQYLQHLVTFFSSTQYTWFAFDRFFGVLLNVLYTTINILILVFHNRLLNITTGRRENVFIYTHTHNYDICIRYLCIITIYNNSQNTDEKNLYGLNETYICYNIAIFFYFFFNFVWCLYLQENNVWSFSLI